MLPPIISNPLFAKNRNRCCICRNPAKPVEIYPLGNRSYKYDPEGLVILCADCHHLAIEAKRQNGQEYVLEELTKYKQHWENECQAWEDGLGYSIRIRQGDFIEDIFKDDVTGVDVFLCAPDYGLYIDAVSDELISFEIRRVLQDGGLSQRRFLWSGRGYEFKFTFTPQKEEYHMLLILKESPYKTCINFRSPLLHRAAFRAIPEKKTDHLQPVKDSSEPGTDSVHWKILPPGEHPFPHILEHCEYLQSNKTRLRIVKERLELLFSLTPSKTYKGLDEFKGYFVFYFEDSGIAVLDSPAIGNAIYILKGDWKILSRLSKAELLRKHKEEVTRIIHAGSWFKRVKEIIDRETMYARERRRIL